MDSPQQSPSTIVKINALLRQMPAGDLARVLLFAEAITQQRSKKRQSRAKRRVKAIDDSWRVGQ